MQRVEFLEAAYQTLVEFELRRSFYLAGQRFVINTYSGRKENTRGYDLEACALVPLFLQLKVSDFYSARSNSPLLRARKKIKIADSPGCYAFSLHPDKKSARYKQHNLLAALHAKGSYARYIAPLFHALSDLERIKYSFWEPYWGTSASGLWDGEWHYWRDYLSFNHSISILPHKAVNDPTTVSHHYTYSLKNHVCFHSEIEQTGDGERLMDSIYQELSRVASSEPIPLAAINARIIDSLVQVEEPASPPARVAENRSQTDQFFILARRLKRSFNIDCILVSNRG